MAGCSTAIEEERRSFLILQGNQGSCLAPLAGWGAPLPLCLPVHISLRLSHSTTTVMAEEGSRARARHLLMWGHVVERCETLAAAYSSRNKEQTDERALEKRHACCSARINAYAHAR